ncbi:hypothetical protein RB195_002786 [Necator americanus]|uniref:Uncharacterized protein n=1 Tax=Necator americanus TaxID=51031 RepID=A0ABR1DM19_NECAM
MSYDEHFTFTTVPYWVSLHPQASRGASSYVAPPQQQPQKQLQGSSGQVPYWVTAYPQASRSYAARRERRLNQSCMELPSHRVEVPHEERTEHIQASYSFLAPQPVPAGFAGGTRLEFFNSSRGEGNAGALHDGGEH